MDQDLKPPKNSKKKLHFIRKALDNGDKVYSKRGALKFVVKKNPPQKADKGGHGPKKTIKKPASKCKHRH